MAQVDPVYRRIAERAREQYNAAIKRKDRPEVIAYLKENREAWDLVDKNLTLFTMALKSLGTSDRCAEMMQVMASDAIYHRQLIPPVED